MSFKSISITPNWLSIVLFDGDGKRRTITLSQGKWTDRSEYNSPKLALEWNQEGIEAAIDEAAVFCGLGEFRERAKQAIQFCDANNERIVIVNEENLFLELQYLEHNYEIMISASSSKELLPETKMVKRLTKMLELANTL